MRQRVDAVVAATSTFNASLTRIDIDMHSCMHGRMLLSLMHLHSIHNLHRRIMGRRASLSQRHQRDAAHHQNGQ